MRGKIIVITGVDASGKGTQTKLLGDEIRVDKDCQIVTPFVATSFPNYKSDTGKMIAAKLKKGDVPNNNASYEEVLQFSLLYSVDRLVSMNSKWIQDALENGKNIVCDRYSESNLIHQSVKIEDLALRDKYEAEILHIEHDKLGVPRPDITIYLGLRHEVVKELLILRGRPLDSHELDDEYLKGCIDRGKELCEKYGWHYIDCNSENWILDPHDIHDLIMNKLAELGVELN